MVFYINSNVDVTHIFVLDVLELLYITSHCKKTTNGDGIKGHNKNCNTES